MEGSFVRDGCPSLGNNKTKKWTFVKKRKTLKRLKRKKDDNDGLLVESSCYIRNDTYVNLPDDKSR